MKTYEVGDQTGIDSLLMVDRANPEPAAGEALIKFHANSLNYRDYMIVSGLYGPPKDKTLIPVSDGAGEVISVAADVHQVKVGDRVAVNFFSRWIDGTFGGQYFGSDLGGGADGTLCEFGVFPADSLALLPDAFSYEEGACFPCAGVTAWNVIVELGRVKAGDTVLLLGTGGVSMFGVQIAKAKGARAIITSSSDEKLEKAKELGADEVVNYKTNQDWPAIVVELSGGGADIVVETGGPASFDTTFAACAFGARVGLIGNLAGTADSINLMPMVGKGITLKGVAVGSRRMLDDLISTMRDASLHPMIDKTFDFKDAADAYRHLASQKHQGKVVISR